ncbi:ATP-binding protein [Streptomyces sp. 2231.1]|uniref:ATP-binding protein n=1 Tax=Streptomyces sp. 2231.1 TaxID=1855347 RepID=UPI00352627D7
MESPQAPQPTCGPRRRARARRQRRRARRPGFWERASQECLPGKHAPLRFRLDSALYLVRCASASSAALCWCSVSWPAPTGITVNVRGTADAVILGVADDGHGVAPQDRERIFERSVRLDEARSRDDGGTGRGPAIARDVVQLHGETLDMKRRTRRTPPAAERSSRSDCPARTERRRAQPPARATADPSPGIGGETLEICWARARRLLGRLFTASP